MDISHSISSGERHFWLSPVDANDRLDTQALQFMEGLFSIGLTARDHLVVYLNGVREVLGWQRVRLNLGMRTSHDLLPFLGKAGVRKDDHQRKRDGFEQGFHVTLFP